MKRLFSLTCFHFLILFFAIQPLYSQDRAVPRGDQISALPGFEVEWIYTVPKEKEGSWVSLTVDERGRFYASDQRDKGLFQIVVSESAQGPAASVKKVEVHDPDKASPVSGAQGLQFAFDSLFFHKNGGHLYRLTDGDGDGELDRAEKIPSQTGGGEHGNHDVITSEDGSSMYLIGGNHAPLADHVRSSVPSWGEDLLNSRMWDPKGHARGRLAPGGWVTRLNRTKYTQEVVSVGYRNAYGLTLNQHGDLFTYDADMEWDLGTPWYRPTRICHVVSGSDFGWRSGTGKWPVYFEDTLPPVIDIGPGSPTGVIFGKGTKFPEKYQKAIFALDWTFGTIYAIHLVEQGASYTGNAEPFVNGTPLPVTDAVVGRDGWLYFLIGGRGAQSAMYRVKHDGKTASPAFEIVDPEVAAGARALRRSLEVFHGVEHSDAVAKAWPLLSNEDRFLRHAARVAVESQPVAGWVQRLWEESNPQAIVTASVALARSGNANLQAALVEKLLSADPSVFSHTQKLGWLRALSLCFIRLGSPLPIQKAQAIAVLDPMLPSDSPELNTELMRMLVYLRASTVIEKGIALIANPSTPETPGWTDLVKRNPGYGRVIQSMLDNPPPAREIGYALMLAELEKGWTMEQRRAYFSFLNEAAKASGGASYAGFLANIRAQALAGCTDEERTALSDITGENYNPVPDFEISPPSGPGKAWTLDEAVAQGSRRNADFERGRSLYFAAGCGACHRLGGLGGGVGPDLTSIPHKFDERYVLEAIIDPSKDISDQYGSSQVTLKDGSIYQGILISKDHRYEVYPPDAKSKPMYIDKESVVSIEESKTSQMPPGLINLLNNDELRDLTAYLMSGGNSADRRFRKKK